MQPLPFLCVDCTLKTYSSANVQGYNGLTIQVDDGFVSSMNAINGYAQDCGITVIVHFFVNVLAYTERCLSFVTSKS